MEHYKISTKYKKGSKGEIEEQKMSDIQKYRRSKLFLSVITLNINELNSH